ncbi:MAG: thymidine phosphorylase [Armatimonadetes bacterium]|nr:thymidine phosphorylase [Armatimonadota bacterium]MDW8027724.1 thymidine phosphorylase [Armatimonadota bacterium]
MLVYEIVRKKLDGEKNTAEEISQLVMGFVHGEVSPEQMATWLAAVYIRGLSDEETWWLTDAMAKSGRILDLSSIEGVKVDKHSTGGVGDKVSIIVVPLVASAGVPVAKLTGRALGHTGGTADKLESIPGMRLSLSEEEFIAQVKRIGCAIAVTTEDIAPADKKIYALRDKTATVASIPLIVSSILSKKIAGGADAFVFDVKFGDGAFMRRLEDAKALAEGLVKTAKLAGKKAVGVLSSMEQPLGRAIGNAVEVEEAIEVLKGKGQEDVRELCLEISALMLWLGGAVTNPEEGKSKATELLDSGAALESFRKLVAAQGGDEKVVDEPERLPKPSFKREVKATQRGTISAISTRQLGIIAGLLGAARIGSEKVDPAAGIIVLKKVGEKVDLGEPVAILQSSNPIDNDLLDKVGACFKFGEVEKIPSILAGFIG